MIHIHQHMRKRLNKDIAPYPHPKAKLRILDTIVSITAVAFPLAVLPQILKIWVDKETSGVSLLTWSLFLVFTTPLLAYAMAHKDKKLTIMYSLFGISYILILVGVPLFN